ncbi:MAG: class I SAM-dependent methyltransferase [Halobacteriota archaeon]
MHKGKVVAEKGGYKVIDCEICEFKHLDPVPSSEELLEFYQKKYYNLVKRGGRAPEIRRQMARGKEAESELEWLSRTLYSEILYVLEDQIHNHRRLKHLLDIGSGTGEFLRYMMNAGWSVIGIEPSEESVQVASSELTIYTTSLEEFIATHPDYKNKFDAITLLNVLEHVPNPVEFLKHTKKLLKPRTGVICIRVPNDFNELQNHAERKLNKTLWWVAIPDHINYFDIESLQKLVKSLGFEVLYTSVDFPMELFLLMGDDYIGNPEVGSLCHRKRVSFELSIPDALRREISQSLARIGIGRDCMVFAKIK